MINLLGSSATLHAAVTVPAKGCGTRLPPRCAARASSIIRFTPNASAVLALLFAPIGHYAPEDKNPDPKEENEHTDYSVVSVSVGGLADGVPDA